MRKALLLIICIFHFYELPAQSNSELQTVALDRGHSTFEVQYIRNATVKITYGNDILLVDPVLADKGTDAAILFSNDTKVPILDLPFSIEEVLNGVNAVLLTHYHRDHFDGEAERVLPKDLLIFCQPSDTLRLKDKGFTNLRSIDSLANWNGLEIQRFRASHFKGATGELPFGESSSYSLSYKSETLFITGDAILDQLLKNALAKSNPDLIIANAGECQFTEPNPVANPGEPLTLSADDLLELTMLFPKSKIIAMHMDAMNHCILSKDDLKEFVKNHRLSEFIFVPDEGETLRF